jgi:hypothetical protein
MVRPGRGSHVAPMSRAGLKVRCVHEDEERLVTACLVADGTTKDQFASPLGPPRFLSVVELSRQMFVEVCCAECDPENRSV